MIGSLYPFGIKQNAGTIQKNCLHTHKVNHKIKSQKLNREYLFHILLTSGNYLMNEHHPTIFMTTILLYYSLFQNCNDEIMKDW